jgi:hypothetical protein
MGVLPQALWSAKEKKLLKNNKKKNELSNLENLFFFFSYSLDPSCFQTSYFKIFLFI